MARRTVDVARPVMRASSGQWLGRWEGWRLALSPLCTWPIAASSAPPWGWQLQLASLYRSPGPQCAVPGDSRHRHWHAEESHTREGVSPHLLHLSKYFYVTQ